MKTVRKQSKQGPKRSPTQAFQIVTHNVTPATNPKQVTPRPKNIKNKIYFWILTSPFSFRLAIRTPEKEKNWRSGPHKTKTNWRSGHHKTKNNWRPGPHKTKKIGDLGPQKRKKLAIRGPQNEKNWRSGRHKKKTNGDPGPTKTKKLAIRAPQNEKIN